MERKQEAPSKGGQESCLLPDWVFFFFFFSDWVFICTRSAETEDAEKTRPPYVAGRGQDGMGNRSRRSFEILKLCSLDSGVSSVPFPYPRPRRHHLPSRPSSNTCNLPKNSESGRKRRKQVSSWPSRPPHPHRQGSRLRLLARVRVSGS